MAKKDDIFLEEEITTADTGYSYMNGFRFGFGFFTAWLLGMLVIGGIAVAVAVGLHYR